MKRHAKNPISMRVSSYLSVLALAFAVLLAGCSTKPKPAATKPVVTSGGYYQDDGPGSSPPANLDAIADAVPRTERYHSGANKPYTVLGRSYVPVVNNDPFREQGIASWYGKKYHGNMTSIGETYDMYAMTAAHPTLPLPSYVRVTNPANGRAVVVRVNDRGPFHAERIIDLSYTAAAKLDIAQRGSGMVIVERVFAGAVPSTTPSAPAPVVATTAATQPVQSPVAPTVITTSPVTSEAGDLFLQLGAFSSADNAEQFRNRVATTLDWNREPITIAARSGLFRVRMGPYKTRDEADGVAARVQATMQISPIISKP